MEYNKSVTDIIKSRTSVRSYKEQSLTDELRNQLQDYISHVQGPFDATVRFKIIDSNSIDKSTDVKLGTYGVIRGTSTFIAAAMEKKDKGLEQLGYTLEKVILYAASIGLGTCWMGGTFKRGEFAKAIALRGDEILPIVTPVGYPKEKRGIIDTMFRLGAGSNKRKNFTELFYKNNFNSSLSETDAGKYQVVLEMVRLAPSASNKQPWRIVKENDNFHFYLRHDKGYGTALGFDMQKIDIGIAMSHFEATARELGFDGNWTTKEPSLGALPEGFEYIVSWISK